jgi:hypothetical protein
MPIPKFDGIEVPKSDENEIPYCPKCSSKRFLLTETDTVCARCGNVFAADNVPWRPMKKGEFAAEVKRRDGSPVYIPDEIEGEWNPEARAYWDSFTGTWFKVTSVESVEVPKDEAFRWLVRGAA